MELNELVDCPHCKSKVLRKNLQKHLKKVHNSATTSITLQSQVINQESNIKNKISITKSYYKCKQCSKKITKSSLVSHLNKVHQFYPKNLVFIEQYYYEKIDVKFEKSFHKDDLLKNVSDTYTKLKNNIQKYSACPFCKLRLSTANFSEHIRTNHKVEIFTHDKVHKAKYIVENHQKEEKTYDSDDIFDRGLTVQGGAYGLGKNRKH